MEKIAKSKKIIEQVNNHSVGQTLFTTNIGEETGIRKRSTYFCFDRLWAWWHGVSYDKNKVAEKIIETFQAVEINRLNIGFQDLQAFSSNLQKLKDKFNLSCDDKLMMLIHRIREATTTQNTRGYHSHNSTSYFKFTTLPDPLEGDACSGAPDIITPRSSGQDQKVERFRPLSNAIDNSVQSEQNNKFHNNDISFNSIAQSDYSIPAADSYRAQENSHDILNNNCSYSFSNNYQYSSDIEYDNDEDDTALSNTPNTITSKHSNSLENYASQELKTAALKFISRCIDNENELDMFRDNILELNDAYKEDIAIIDPLLYDLERCICYIENNNKSFIQALARLHIGIESIDSSKDIQLLQSLTSRYSKTELYQQDLGIQGKNNSCYMDCALFTMFALTNNFDYMFDSNLYEDGSEKQTFVRFIMEQIATPLRTEGLVSAQTMTAFREMFQKLSNKSTGDAQNKGFMKDQKDIEEFFTVLLDRILDHNLIQYETVTPQGLKKSALGIGILQLFDFDSIRSIRDVQDLVSATINDESAQLDFTNLQNQIPHRNRNLFLLLAKDLKHTASGAVSTYVNDLEYVIPNHEITTLNATFELKSIITHKSSHFDLFFPLNNKKGETEWYKFDSMSVRSRDNVDHPRITKIDGLGTFLEDLASNPQGTIEQLNKNIQELKSIRCQTQKQNPLNNSWEDSDEAQELSKLEEHQRIVKHVHALSYQRKMKSDYLSWPNRTSGLIRAF